MDCTRTSVYVGMALTEAPEEFRTEFQTELKAALREIEEVDILDFIGLENGSDVDVFNHDFKCTVEAALCVFVVDHPSIGLGMEIMARYQIGGHFMVCARHGQRVTRMLTGMLSKSGKQVHCYDSVSDIVKAVKGRLNDMGVTA